MIKGIWLCFPSYLLFTAILTSIAKPLPTGTFVVSHGINGHTVYLIRHIDISMLWVCVFKYVCLVGLACCYGWMEVFIFSAVIWPLILSVCVCLCVWLSGKLAIFTHHFPGCSLECCCRMWTSYTSPNQHFYTSLCPMDPLSPSPNLASCPLCCCGWCNLGGAIAHCHILNSHCVPDISSLSGPRESVAHQSPGAKRNQAPWSTLIKLFVWLFR